MQRISALLLAGALTGCAASTGSSAETNSSAQAAAAKSQDTAKPAAKTAATLPDFTLETLEGEEFVLSEHVGKEVIVLSFWATWCNPCLAELPHLSDLYQAHKDKGLLIVAVSMDEPKTQAEVASTVQRLGLDMPVVLDTEQQAIRLYNRGRDAPMTVVIDRAGKIVKAQAGYNPGDEKLLAEQLQKLLKES